MAHQSAIVTFRAKVDIELVRELERLCAIADVPLPPDPINHKQPDLKMAWRLKGLSDALRVANDALEAKGKSDA